MAASTAHRQQTGHANTMHDSGDFPIVIGESLKNNTSSRSELLRLRYNWKPDKGFNSQRGTMKHAKGDVRLAYKDDKTEASTYEYKSAINDPKSDELEKSMSRLVLIFDPDRSAYVLEKISHSVDLNLVSAHDQSQDEVEVHKSIGSSIEDSDLGQSNGELTSTTQDEDKADPTNPFDFRHFLSEAKENAEKASQLAGGRTPVPGGRTPMSGISSPSLVPGRFLSNNTSQLRQAPASVPSVTKKSQPAKPTPSVFSKKQTTNKRKPAVSAPKTSLVQPLSKEIISDSSDEESNNAAPVSRPSASQTDDRGRDRDASPPSSARSPNNLVYNEGGLEIVMGSPPPETKKRGNLDVGAFRSGTHTPTLGISSNRRPPLHSHMDIEMKDASDSEQDANSEDNDVVEDDDDEDMDEDVDVLELGSPRSKKLDQQREESERPPAPPTPQPPPLEDDEDEDLLAEELARAMEQDNEPTNLDDDESEVSEEE